jgi:hypothetical protein
MPWHGLTHQGFDVGDGLGVAMVMMSQPRG